MPTQQTTYNSRITDEALEKRFRDTFKAQGGSELVDDLYAQGVIVPVVDFTAAATGQQLAENLQTAWDFTTGLTYVSGATSTLISNAGFWQVDLTAHMRFDNPTNATLYIFIDDGASTTQVYNFVETGPQITEQFAITDQKFVVFLRSGDSLKATASTTCSASIWYRQIATVSGDLVNPSGFTSS